MKGKKLHIKTYGCQMNVHETEKIYADFINEGCIATDKIEDADIIIYNTCCIREGAETRVLGNLGMAKKLKEKNPGLIIAVCGCMTQQQKQAEYLHKRCPFINVITGTYKLRNLIDMIKSAGDGYYSDLTVDESVPHGINLAHRRTGVNNYVNITYGCNNFCTYCIVPYVKGRERSRHMSDIKQEVAGLILGGVKEITLLGQNVNSYKDDEGHDFYELMNELAALDGDFWIKFMTSHPKDLSKEVIKLIGREPKLANYVHLPLQSGSDRILKEMNRGYTLAEYMQKIDWIKEFIPDSGLTSDIIIGFPGESESDYRATEDAVKNIGYNNLFMFLYSKRNGTPAADMSDQIPEKVKKDRINRLIAVQSDIENLLAKTYVGKTCRILCDKEGDVSLGKTESDKPVIIENGQKGIYNTFIDVEIIKAVNSKLYGKIKEL